MQLSSCWSVSQACHVICTMLINSPSPPNDTASLITYAIRVSDTNIYTLNPMESNQRDGPTSHKNHWVHYISDFISFQIKQLNRSWGGGWTDSITMYWITVWFTTTEAYTMTTSNIIQYNMNLFVCTKCD